jgi:hypothetical protein
MNLKIQKVVTILLVSTMLFSPLLLIAPSYAQATQILFYGPNGIANEVVDVYDNFETFTVACVIEDVTNLDGGDIQIVWDSTYLSYVSHTATVTVEDYPTPVAPGPHAGIIHSPKLQLKDEVNTSDPLPHYWWAFATLGGPSFTGSGTAFNMTFMTGNVPFGDPLDHFNTTIWFYSTDLAGSAGAITHDRINMTVRIHYKEFTYPEWPVLRVLDNDDGDTTLECKGVGQNVTADVILQGKNMTSGELTDLSPFWDVSGVDAILHYDPLMLSFVDMQIDPDGWFASFWDGGIFIVDESNIPGQVHFAFVGIPLPSHTPVWGQGAVLRVIFESLTESAEFPPGESLICLENPQTFTGQYNFDSIGGTIDLTTPVGNTFHELTPDYCEGPFEMMSWVDDDGDSELSSGDHFIMEDLSTGFYFNYLLEEIACTLNLTLAKSLDEYFWPATFPLDGLLNNGLPGKTIGTPPPDPYDGHGGSWYGNFSTTYPVQSVNSITVTALPFTADEYTYTLTEGVDFLVHDDDNLIELLHELDDEIINEYWVDGVNNSLNGWPYINYVASGIESVYRRFPAYNDYYGETEGYAAMAYAATPPNECWYDPDWPWELEGWWALGYFCPADYCWPDGTEWWINYTAVPYLDINYNTDPVTTFVEYDGTYEDCLAITDANGTHWNEVYPRSFQSYDCVFHDDVDTSSSITVGDWLWMSDLKQFIVEGVSTDLTCLQKSWISNEDPDPIVDPFFGVAPIVTVPGFPHAERDYSPWFNKEYSVPLPHDTECATYVECFKPTGGFIDVYTQNGGEGYMEPGGLFWPQKNVHVCANVTYGGWPEQNKDVAFQVIAPNGTMGIWYGRTNEVGVACVDIRLPWPCDNPEDIFGEWCIIATVDVACVVVNDTVCFKYDYRVHITDVALDKAEYKHCEDILITVWWLTRSMQEFNITFTVTAVDASGVPFGFDYVTVTIGGAQYCSYVDGTVELTVHVEKWARPPIGTIYVGALSGFPQDGGSAETPVYSAVFTILPEWA